MSASTGASSRCCLVSQSVSLSMSDFTSLPLPMSVSVVLWTVSLVLSLYTLLFLGHLISSRNLPVSIIFSLALSFPPSLGLPQSL